MVKPRGQNSELSYNVIAPMMADAELPSRVMQPQASSTSSGNLWKGRLLSDEALWET